MIHPSQLNSVGRKLLAASLSGVGAVPRCENGYYGIIDRSVVGRRFYSDEHTQA